MSQYDYAHTDFANDIWNEDKLAQEVAANESITTALDYIKSVEGVDGNGDPTGNFTVSFVFPTDLAAGEQTALDALVAAHAGAAPTTLKYHASSKLIEGEVAITEASGWQVLGGVVTTPSFFCPTIACLLGRMVGSCKAVGTGAKLRVVEDGTTVIATFDVPDTSGAWDKMQFFTSTPPSEGTHEYTIEGQLDTATSASVRFVSMSLLEVTS